MLQIRMLLGNAARLLQAGQVRQAQALCHQVLHGQPQQPDALHLLGVAHMHAGDFDESQRLIAESLKINPTNAAAHNNRGIALRRLSRFEHAVESFDAALKIKPDYVEALANRGVALHELGRLDQALESLDAAGALKPDIASVHNNRGNVLFKLRRHAEALASFDQAIALKADYAEAHNNRGNALHALLQAERALVSYERAIALKPDYVEAQVNRGSMLVELRRHDEALVALDRAIALNADYAAAHGSRGNALLELKRIDEALASYDRALALRPNDEDVWGDRGEALIKARRYSQAIASFERLLQLNPDYPFARGNLLHARMLCCNWTDYDPLAASVQVALRDGRRSAEPFGYQAAADSEADLLACARIYAQAEYPAAPMPAQASAPRSDERIVIGYLCGEFRQHATSILMCGVWESHDRSRFRLIAFDNGWSDGSDYRRRIEAAFDEVVDISQLNDQQAAGMIRAKGVDVLVNLNGYFGESRLGVFAQRASPIQVNYLGFPGTLGTDYLDYLIADRIVIPDDSRRFYSEHIVWLPDSYQANDARRAISEQPLHRADFGLPDTAFVYCCFNNNYKLTPTVFAGWMRILRRVPDAVLWLLEDNADASANLHAQARHAGIAAERLIFAPRLPPAEHLARQRLADLFLDTLPYNAHTTAADALWAGLPLLTQRGATFPGRVGASLLSALGLPELVTETPAAYEAMAVALATDRARLAALREKLSVQRTTQALFDTRCFTTYLESAFATMVERGRAGLAPAHFSVSR